MRSKISLVLDGHDGSGKTTLATALAHKLNADYVQPFHGATGELLLWSAERGNTRFAFELASHLIEKALSETEAPIVVFDRHWLTVLSLLPEQSWQELLVTWENLPPTVLCWAGLKTTQARLACRTEKQYPESYHRDYLRRYGSLHHRFGATLLRTDRQTMEECVDELVNWAKKFT
ncbi:MAG: hypothetical protein WCS37_21300 [Chloroflexota bacterium]|nr:hypothetical protein [Chloroflexota bacterium]